CCVCLGRARCAHAPHPGQLRWTWCSGNSRLSTHRISTPCAATYADDVLITRGPEKKQFVQGKQELRDVYGKMFAKYPNCRARLAERKTEGEKVVLDHEIITGRGPERPDPWDIGFVRYVVENGKIKAVELP